MVNNNVVIELITRNSGKRGYGFKFKPLVLEETDPEKKRNSRKIKPSSNFSGDGKHDNP